MICEVCQTNSKLNISRFILVKTDNKIITKSGDNLVFPTCACDFADPLNCQQVVKLFGKARIDKILWPLLHSKEGSCNKCSKESLPVASVVVQKQD
jgi:hypothetical protein